MPTYVYECSETGKRFERRQSMKEAPLERCPECGAPCTRIIVPGTAIHIRGKAAGPVPTAGPLQPGCGRSTTCCGRETPCAVKPCHKD